MNMQHVAARKVTIASAHFEALMTKYLLEACDVATIYEVVVLH